MATFILFGIATLSLLVLQVAAVNDVVSSERRFMLANIELGYLLQG